MRLNLERSTTLSLTRQVVVQIKGMILRGELAAGQRLPSTRSLAAELQVSRNIFLEAYDQLMAEGYLEARQGSKTVVADGISASARLSDPLREDMGEQSGIGKEQGLDFKTGCPDLELFPRKEWGRLYHELCSKLPETAFQYGSPMGVWELRKEVSAYLHRTRGIQCPPERIMIVSGSTQGLSLISALLYKPNKKVVVEDPLHAGLKHVITGTGYSLEGIETDRKGMRTELLQPSDNAAFLYTTPSHQFPTGGILPVQRRLELIRYAVENNTYVIEDDYDSEFRYGGPPVSSLHELNPDRVIYIGSFSKILAPAVRLGYMLLPGELLDSCKELKKYTDVHTETLSQHVLAEFVRSGMLERHIWKMKKVYRKKRECLLQQLENRFGGSFEIEGHAAGLHLVVHFRDIVFSEEILERLAREKVKIYPLEQYALKRKEKHRHEILIGYGHLSLKEITDGVERLGRVLG